MHRHHLVQRHQPHHPAYMRVRDHHPHPRTPAARSPSRPHQRTQAFGIKKTRTGHVNDQAQPAGIKYRAQHTGNSRGTWQASPGAPAHDRTPDKPAHRKPGPMTTRAHNTPIPASTRYQPGMPSRSRAAHTHGRHSSRQRRLSTRQGVRRRCGGVPRGPSGRRRLPARHSNARPRPDTLIQVATSISLPSRRPVSTLRLLLFPGRLGAAGVECGGARPRPGRMFFPWCLPFRGRHGW